MADLTFVSSVNGMIGKPIHVTVFENGSPVSDVTWVGTTSTMTVVADPSVPGGFNISDTVVEALAITAVRAADGAMGILQVAFSAPPTLQFTSP